MKESCVYVINKILCVESKSREFILDIVVNEVEMKIMFQVLINNK